MIRMVLFGLAFVAVTIVLVVMQPGAGRLAANDPAPEPMVTRAEPALSQPAQHNPLGNVPTPVALAAPKSPVPAARNPK